MFGISKKSDKEIKQFFENEQKEQRESQLKWHNYLLSAIFVLSGLILIFYVQIDIPFICKFLSVVFALAGLVSVICYCIRDVAEGYYRLELVYGITAGFVALLFFTKQDTVGAYFPIIAGCILFANGMVKLQHSIDMKRIDRKMKKVTEMWLVVMIFALACIAAGFVTAYIKTAEDRTMFLVIGISFVVAGLSDVFVHIVFNRKVRAFRSGVVEADSDSGADAEEGFDWTAKAVKDEKPEKADIQYDITEETKTEEPAVLETVDIQETVDIPETEVIPEAEDIVNSEPEPEPGSESEPESEPEEVSASPAGAIKFPSWKV